LGWFRGKEEDRKIRQGKERGGKNECTDEEKERRWANGRI